MKWKNAAVREYYSKYKKVDIKNDQGWFEVYDLPGTVYAICEPQHFQEVNSYLIIGSEKGLLFDTGMGVRNIDLVVKELYEGELIVVNSHFHFDHIGDNYRFGEVHILMINMPERQQVQDLKDPAWAISSMRTCSCSITLKALIQMRSGFLLTM